MWIFAFKQCKLQINKEGKVRRSKWDVQPLTPEQQIYAAIDVYVSFKIHTSPPFPTATKSTLSLSLSTTCICKHENTTQHNSNNNIKTKSDAHHHPIIILLSTTTAAYRFPK